MRFLSLLLFLTFVSASGAVSAHDFWLQPNHYWTPPNSEVAATLQVGHGPNRQRSPIPAGRITQIYSVGPGGLADQRSGLRLGEPARDMDLRIGEPGTYLLALETNNAVSNLPSIRFNDYLKAEGLTLAMGWRARTGAMDSPGRELYSRHTKAIIRVGGPTPDKSPQVTKPLGLALEIVPDVDPYELAPAGSLPVRILYDGRPLAGALVKLTDLHADEKPVETHVTDAGGTAAFTIPGKGAWLLNVIWSEPLPVNRNAEYLTLFSSLSWGSNDAAR